MCLEENVNFCKYLFPPCNLFCMFSFQKVNFLLLVLICLSVCALSHGKVTFGS